jgi:hypothetical protein
MLERTGEKAQMWQRLSPGRGVGSSVSDVEVELQPGVPGPLEMIAAPATVPADLPGQATTHHNTGWHRPPLFTFIRKTHPFLLAGPSLDEVPGRLHK